MKKKILLTAFQGTSSEMLLKDIEDFQTLILLNDKVKDSEKLIDALSKEHFDYVISFGQRPNIKNCVHVETTAKDGVLSLDTVFDYGKLIQLFKRNGIPAKLSNNAGTSFCNRLYWNGLQYIRENELETKMVFVHVPFMKNIEAFEVFKERIIKTVDMYRL